MSKSVHRIGVNGVRWNVRVPRWFAMKVWLWIPGKWHWQMCTGPVVRPGPIFARGISSDSWGCTACAHRSDSWPEYDAHKAVHHPTVLEGDRG